MSKNSNNGSDLATYIANNTEPLTEQNYTDIDALVFAELSYARFEDNDNITPNMSVSEFAAELLRTEEPSKTDLIIFLKNVAQSDRYAGCTIMDCVAENSDSQWAALTIQMEKGNPDAEIIAMRGTNGTTLGWTEDFELFYDNDGTRAQQLSADYLSRHADAERIYMTGHSKGGNDVISAYMMNESAIRDKVCRVNNFDGPGVNPDYVSYDAEYAIAYEELQEKLYNVYPSNSIIGRLLIDNPGDSTYIECNTEGHVEIPLLGEHDPFSFQINEQGMFVTKKPSVISDYINTFVDEAMNSLSFEERRDIVDVLIAFGVPALIAKDENGNPYIQSEHKLQKALEIWNHCSKRQKESVRNLIVGGACGVCNKAISDLNQAMDRTYYKLKHGFQTFTDNISTMAKRVKQGVWDFGNTVIDGVTDFFQEFKAFITTNSRKITHLFDLPDETGGLLSGGNFYVNLGRLKSKYREMADVSDELSSCYKDVQAIASQLQIGQAMDKLNQILLMVMELVKECDTCNGSLKDIIEAYYDTEMKCLL